MGPYQMSKPTKGRSSLRHIAPSQAQQQAAPPHLTLAPTPTLTPTLAPTLALTPTLALAPALALTSPGRPLAWRC